MRPATSGLTLGKTFDATGAIGPWLVPVESPAQCADIALGTPMNGTLHQAGRTARMIFAVPGMIDRVATLHRPPLRST